MNPIENAKAQVAQATEQLKKVFSHVPDDRLNWQPSPSSRSPIMQVAHSAESLWHIQEMLQGRPYSAPTMAEADAAFMANDKAFSTREEVLEVLDRNTAAYLATLDELDPEQLEREVALPFHLGSAPLIAILAVGADHTRWHAAQLDYMHTIYGDRDWHG